MKVFDINWNIILTLKEMQKKGDYLFLACEMLT